jgi:hypothetical protein
LAINGAGKGNRIFVHKAVQNALRCRPVYVRRIALLAERSPLLVEMESLFCQRSVKLTHQRSK